MVRFKGGSTTWHERLITTRLASALCFCILTPHEDHYLEYQVEWKDAAACGPTGHHPLGVVRSPGTKVSFEVVHTDAQLGRIFAEA